MTFIGALTFFEIGFFLIVQYESYSWRLTEELKEYFFSGAAFFKNPLQNRLVFECVEFHEIYF